MRSSLRRTFLLSVIPLFLFGCLQNLSAKEYRVRQVVDGDTIELEGGQMVRYLGIDTPETRKRQDGSWVYQPQPYSEEAKEFNRKLVEGKTVRLEFDVQKRDKYNRLLAYCFVDGAFVNAELLKEGLAFLYSSPPNIKYVDIFVKLQQEARQNNRGLWGANPVISPKEAKDYLDRFVTVEARVSSIRQSPKVTTLNFGQSRFKAVIFKEQLSFFMTGGVSIQSYRGKTIRVTGKIQKYKDSFEIIIRHPSAIEVVD